MSTRKGRDRGLCLSLSKNYPFCARRTSTDRGMVWKGGGKPPLPRFNQSDFAHPGKIRFQAGDFVDSLRQRPRSLPFFALLCRKSRMVLFFLAREENADDCTDQKNRRCSGKQPLKCVYCHSKNGGFRISIIPPQVRTFERQYCRRNCPLPQATHVNIFRKLEFISFLQNSWVGHPLDSLVLLV